MVEKDQRLDPLSPEQPNIWEWIRKAFSEFLLIPTLIVLAFFMLGGLLYAIDLLQPGFLQPLSEFLKANLFSAKDETERFLATVTGGMMTVTSITISMLLIALQQSASNMGNMVFDQFLSRRRNQAFFGYLVGLGMYAVVLLGINGEKTILVFSATAVLFMTGIALYILIVMVYTAIHQMRPELVLGTIHDNTLIARKNQRQFLSRTRRKSAFIGQARRIVQAHVNGFVISIDLQPFDQVVTETLGGCEFEMLVTLGEYVSYNDDIAVVIGMEEADLDSLEKAVHRSIQIARQREMTIDPYYGLEQIEEIAWTAISTAKATPETGQLAIRVLRDILARWVAEREQPEPKPDQKAPLPVIYNDNVEIRAIDTLESLAIASGESYQHQSIKEILRAIMVIYPRMGEDMQGYSESMLMRILPALRQHVLSGELDATISLLIDTLDKAGADQVAEAYRQVRQHLADVQRPRQDANVSYG